MHDLPRLTIEDACCIINIVSHCIGQYGQPRDAAMTLDGARGAKTYGIEVHIMSIKLVLDSAADLTSMDGIAFAVAPLKVCTAEREFIDNNSATVSEMVDYLYSYKGRSSTSCPNTADWLAAFGEAEEIVCITITGGLSGSYNSACAAKEIYEDSHPGARVLVFDSLSAGPEIALKAERVAAMIRDGESMDSIQAMLDGYSTEIVFVLESLKNFANNGRVSKAVAAAAGIFGIRALGRASEEGTLEVLDKVRGEAKALRAVVDNMIRYGYKGGKVRIDHCLADAVAEKLQALIRESYPNADILVRPTRVLCSYYAEKGGYLVGFEC